LVTGIVNRSDCTWPVTVWKTIKRTVRKGIFIKQEQGYWTKCTFFSLKSVWAGKLVGEKRGERKEERGKRRGERGEGREERGER
jgi:hypothetical protein